MLQHLSFTRRLNQVQTVLAFLMALLLIIFCFIQPVQAEEAVTGLSADIKAPVAARLAGGLLHSAMINYDGQLYVWGDNTYGQLGLGSLDYSDLPLNLPLPGKAIEISLGAYHTLILLDDGSVYACGRNAFGQLGTGDTEISSQPVKIEGLPAITSVKAGAWHSMALGADGSVWAWGNNTNFQVGDVPSETIKDDSNQILGTRCIKPVKVVDSGAAAIAAGGQFSMYLGMDGKVYAWGDNSRGQLGDGTIQPHGTPVSVPGLESTAAISAGYEHSMALLRLENHDELFTWGDDSLGQLGIGSDPLAKTNRTLPERVDINGNQNAADDHILMIQAGFSQSAAVVPRTLADGSLDQNRQQLMVWGNNNAGQLALGKTGSQNKPVAINGTFDGWTGNNFLPFDAVAFGGYHILVLSSKGLLGAAGRGERGQLGNMSILERSQLVSVPINDVIRPIWLDGSSLTARFNEDGDLVIRWPAAQDNRLVAGYKIHLENSNGQIEEVDAGNSLTWTFDRLSDRWAYEITVLAYDSDSFDAENDSLSHLVNYVLPAGAPTEATPSSYFSQIRSSVWQIHTLEHHWQASPRGLLQPLEVPWNAAAIYGRARIPIPAIWQVFNYTAILAGILILLAIADRWRRHIKRKKKKLTPSAMNTGRQQQAG